MGMTKVWVSGMLLSLAKCSWTHTFNLSHATTLYCAFRVDYMCVCLPQRLFRVPPVPGKHIPYTRVNHNKYMVTDNAAYVSELYKNTCLKQLRDWRKKDGTINWRLLIKAEELSMKRDITRNSSIFIFPSLVPLPSDFLCCFPFLLHSLPFVSPSLLPLVFSSSSLMAKGLPRALTMPLVDCLTSELIRYGTPHTLSPLLFLLHSLSLSFYVPFSFYTLAVAPDIK